MLNFLKTTFTDVTDEDISQQKFVDENIAWHGARATKHSQAYLVDRMWK
jgi:hypothetical protein